jgi:serralysin
MKVCIDKVVPIGKQVEAANLAQVQGNAADSVLMPDVLARLGGETMSAVLVTGKRWKPGQTITISFLSGSEALRARVRKYANRWLWDANLKFQWLGINGRGMIRIAFDEGGSWSYVGTDAMTIPRPRPTMNYGWLTEATPEDEARRVIVHEFGHMLGLGHEHSHPKGGIPWDREAAYAYYAQQGWSREDVDRQVFQRYAVTQTSFSRYDPRSIMHYAIPPELLTDPSKAVGWNTYRSGTDRSFIKAQYPKTITQAVGARARELVALAADATK